MKTTNHFAVIIAAIVFFVLGAAWYTVLSGAWLDGIGKTMAQLEAETKGSKISMLWGFLAILVMCYTLNSLLNRLGDTTAAAGAKLGAIVALGFVAANIALNYAFENRSPALWMINSGYVLVGLTIAGAIIGGWRKKPAVA